MILINNINIMKSTIQKIKIKGKKIGFVPTMGYLHQGHISLIKRARMENDFVVISIFVNPAQFGPGEDYLSYPRDLDRDRILAREAGVDILFNPSAGEMYPENFKTYLHLEEIGNKMCGASRPNHFNGVATVVNKLFNIVKPDKAYFGQKDAQQVAVIRQMTEDLCMDVEIISCPIIRDKDGLALSSRNVYLDTEERKTAVLLYRSLMEARHLIQAGEIDVEVIRRKIFETIGQIPNAHIDYIEIVDPHHLKKLNGIEGDGNSLIAIAVKIGRTRLIDNILI